VDAGRGPFAERQKALAWGKIAQIYAARGDYRTAINVLESEVVPVAIKLGDETNLVGHRAQLAIWLYDQDSARATTLFQQSLTAARRMRPPVVPQIESLMKEHGIPIE